MMDGVASSLADRIMQHSWKCREGTIVQREGSMTVSMMKKGKNLWIFSLMFKSFVLRNGFFSVILDPYHFENLYYILTSFPKRVSRKHILFFKWFVCSDSIFNMMKMCTQTVVHVPQRYFYLSWWYFLKSSVITHINICFMLSCINVGTL